MPLPPVFGIAPFNVGGTSCETARRVVAPYGRHSPQKAGGSGDPPLQGNFGPGRCDGHRSHETEPVSPEPNWAVKNAVGAALCGRPSPIAGRFPCHPAGFWNSLVRRTPTRTLCHGWSEPGAAVKWHRPKFCTAPGPSGPGGIIPGTIFCAPEILRKGIGVSPVNGGPGENELEPEGTCSRRRCESPPAILWFLSHRRERNSPRRAKPSA